MEILSLDANMGASGDMLLGVLLGLGAERDTLEPIERYLDVRFRVETESRGGIEAIDVRVAVDDDTGARTPDEVRDMIDAVDLEAHVSERAMAIVDRLAAAEAAVHGAAPEETHFHEVGADDAIADICGTVALLDSLAVDEVFVGTVRTGSGTVETTHGTYPIPPPAVTEVAAMADWSIQPGPVEFELLTPTGAAILAELANGVGYHPPMRVDRIGYGAGDRHVDGRPNVLRGVIGSTRGALATDDVALLETVVDDVTPEVIGSLQATLSPLGAHDVTAIPTTMKKSRPGHLIQVVAPTDAAGAIARQLAEEIGTLGVREVPLTHRWVAEREIETVTIDVDDRSFDVRVKLATDGEGALIDASAEYDDALEVASQTQLPVREVCRRTEAKAHEHCS